jgi:hypothetical protein
MIEIEPKRLEVYSACCVCGAIELDGVPILSGEDYDRTTLYRLGIVFSDTYLSSECMEPYAPKKDYEHAHKGLRKSCRGSSKKELIEKGLTELAQVSDEHYFTKDNKRFVFNKTRDGYILDRVINPNHIS